MKKFRRIYHIPASLGATSDDKMMSEIDFANNFYNKYLIMTEKRDGENTTFGPDYCHARSTNSLSMPWQYMVKYIHSCINYDIPNDFRICGENLQAIHSIEYKDLETPFECFMIIEKEKVLSWEDTKQWCEMLKLKTVPVIWEGYIRNTTDFARAFETFQNFKKSDEIEGFVLRAAESFHEKFWNENIGKFVRKNHVKTDKHWSINWKSTIFVKKWDCFVG